MTAVTEPSAPSAPTSYPMERDMRCPFDPAPELERRLEQQPISRVSLWDGSTPWLVTDFEHVRALLADPRVSSDVAVPGYPHVSAGAAARRQEAKSFISMDNPEHAQQRKLLTRDFTVRNTEALRPRIQQIVDDLIDDLLAGPNPADLVDAFALPLPSLVICELLGVPYGDRDFFQDASRTVIARTTSPEQAVAATRALTDYMADLTTRKIDDPGDDVLSRLAVEQVATGAMTAHDVGVMGQLLLIAGHETTANMIALGTAALLEHPDQLAEVRASDDPALIANTVEELLRYLTITHIGRRRVALEDLDVDGVTIRAGEGVILATEAANRDEHAFPDPDTLDIHRSTRHHMAFGHGVHQCLGQPLARIELQVVFSTLYRRIPTLRLAVPRDKLAFKEQMSIYGVECLPVTW